MKKFLPFIISILIGPYCCAQDFAVLDAITLESQEDYQKAEETVLDCTTYLLSTPLQKKNVNRQSATRFVALWMTGTPDYSFAIDATSMEIAGKNELLLGVYMAAMARFVLTNKEYAEDDDEIKLQTVLRTLEYCSEPKNKVKQHKKLKEIIAIERSGDLETYLNIF